MQQWKKGVRLLNVGKLRKKLLKTPKLKMNRTLMNCYIYAFVYIVLSEKQFMILTIINSIVMAGNIITNVTIIHILIKAKQIVNITGKLIFMVSISDLMIGLFCENLQTAIFYEKNCLLGLIFNYFGSLNTFINVFNCNYWHWSLP